MNAPSSVHTGWDREAAVAIARGLLAVRAVEIRPEEPFVWASGWRSPIYCDNRLIWSHPVLREQVLRGLQALLELYAPGVEALAGCATAGIPHAAMLADRLHLPFTYVRTKAKDHGKGRRVEGRLLPGQRVVVVEDTLSTGASAFDAAEAVRSEGAEPVAVMAVFSYGFDVMRVRSESTGIPAYALLDYATLIQTAADMGYVHPRHIEALEAWRAKPQDWQGVAGSGTQG
jgi:orotate phosphoribosyltransferase